MAFSFGSLFGGGGDSGGGGGGGGGLSGNMFSMAGGAVNDIFGGIGDEAKAKGAELEAQQYTEAAKFAGLEANVSANANIVNTAQAQRQAVQAIGATSAAVGGAGLASAGSAADILRQTTQQAALGAAVTNQTGQVQTLGYKEQEKSYELMAEAAQTAAAADKSAAMGSFISGGIKAVGTIAMFA